MSHSEDNFEKLENRIAVLEAGLTKVLNELSKLTTVSELVSFKETAKAKDKLKPDDIERLYNEYGYNKWLIEVVMPHKNVIDIYDDGKHVEELASKDFWDDSTEDSDNMYVKLACLVAWFDVDKVAHNVWIVNKNTNESIKTAGVDGMSYDSIKRGLDDGVKQLVTEYIDWAKDHQLSSTCSLYEGQVGRLHLTVTYASYYDDSSTLKHYTKYKLYWTNEETEEDTN